MKILFCSPCPLDPKLGAAKARTTDAAHKSVVSPTCKGQISVGGAATTPIGVVTTLGVS